MNKEQSIDIRTGTLLTHSRYGDVIARGSVHSSKTWGEMVWIDIPNDDLPYNANIENLEYRAALQPAAASEEVRG